MRIDIQAREYPLTDALKQHAERRIRYALSRNDDCIRRIVMRLSDVNGPRGGADKRCQLRVVLVGMPELVTQDIEADVYLAINRATTRAGRSLDRRLKRNIPKRRHVSASLHEPAVAVRHRGQQRVTSSRPIAGGQAPACVTDEQRIRSDDRTSQR